MEELIKITENDGRLVRVHGVLLLKLNCNKIRKRGK